MKYYIIALPPKNREATGSNAVGDEMDDIRIIAPTGQQVRNSVILTPDSILQFQLSLWVRGEADFSELPFVTEVTRQDVEPVFKAQGFSNKVNAWFEKHLFIVYITGIQKVSA